MRGTGLPALWASGIAAAIGAGLGLPLAFALWNNGAEVHLANLSFSELELVDRDEWISDQVVAVTLRSPCQMEPTFPPTVQ